MIHTSNLRWGLHSFPPLEALAAFGARTIFQNGKIDFLPDRRDCLGETDVCNALCSWINHKALPALNEHIKNHAWTPKKRTTHSHWKTTFIVLRHHLAPVPVIFT